MAGYAETLGRRLMMKRIATTLISLFMFSSSVTYAQVSSQFAASQIPVQNSQTIKITRSGSQHPNKGPGEYFTGSVQVQPLFPAIDPSRTSGGKVTFEPGARSAWHTHAFGQILIVTEGTGWIQQWGGQMTAHPSPTFSNSALGVELSPASGHAGLNRP